MFRVRFWYFEENECLQQPCLKSLKRLTASSQTNILLKCKNFEQKWFWAVNRYTRQDVEMWRGAALSAM